MFEFETEVLGIIPRTYNVKSFRFKSKESANFKPGQFFFVTIKNDGKELTKHFSFSNSPTEKGYIEFTKRITDSEFSKALNKLKIGDWARLRMPLGQFTFEGEFKKLALLSGGIGITPLRSIIKYIFDMHLPTDVVLLYGNNKEQDIIFKQDFDIMASANKKIHLIYTLTSPEIDKQKWNGEIDYIDDNMIKKYVPDLTERIFYMCGPPKMVQTLMEILKTKLNIPDKQIKTENFTGY